MQMQRGSSLDRQVAGGASAGGMGWLFDQRNPMPTTDAFITVLANRLAAPGYQSVPQIWFLTPVPLVSLDWKPRTNGRENWLAAFAGNWSI
jgi:hypothetical protein